ATAPPTAPSPTPTSAAAAPPPPPTTAAIRRPGGHPAVTAAAPPGSARHTGVPASTAPLGLASLRCRAVRRPVVTVSDRAAPIAPLERALAVEAATPTAFAHETALGSLW